MQPLACRPLVIIGAPRSGTNMLRDLLVEFTGVTTWPCDEINFLWRHGNAGHPTDELRREHARPRVISYMRRQFARLARRTGATTVVEKTCANALRVEFVDAILPEARFIFLSRDGRDAVASAIERWRGTVEPAYVLRKARFVPPTDLPRYAWRFATSRVHQLFSREKQLSTWGPRYAGMQQALAEQGLAAACAEQWRRCQTAAATALAEFPRDRVANVRYEEFVHRPAIELARLLKFAEIDFEGAQVTRVVAGVSTRSVGNWRRADLPESVLARLETRQAA